MRVGFEGLLVNAGEGDTRHGFKAYRLRGEAGGGGTRRSGAD